MAVPARRSSRPWRGCATWCRSRFRKCFFFSSRRRHTRSVSAFLLNRSSDLKVSAEVDLVHQQTQNQRYGSSHIGATAKDISNVVTDAASGVVDIFHGIDKAVADTWNNFWKDGKADGIGSNLSRK